MPRSPRIKSYDSIYHIMCKGNAGGPLFIDKKDKDRYLYLVKKYQEKHEFKVYAYCLMTTHLHMIIDCNGADISRIMHGINQSYAQYFNIKYHRHGHVFQDRFKSKIVQDDRYLITLSAYIHNNPTDIKKFRTCPESFKYSSLGVYLGMKKDLFEILDESFIMGLFSADVDKARERYYKMVLLCKNPNMIKEIEFKNEKSEYRSERVILVRDITPEKLMNFVSGYTGIEVDEIKRKHRRQSTESRALCAFLIRCYCDFRYKDICGILGGLTLARISGLVNKGIELINSDERYKNVAKDFLNEGKAS